MDAKQEILAAIREARPQGDFPLPEVHVYPPDHQDDPVAHFTKTLEAMGGKLLDAGQGSLVDAVRGRFPDARNVVSATPEVPSDRDLSAVQHQADLHDVDVAVIRARLGVAESGSVLFVGEDLVVNSLAYLAEHLVVLLDPAEVVPGLQDAYLHPDFHEHNYAVFHSGPSATADIEGVLIHGAQGVRSLEVVLAPRPSDGQG